MGAQAGKKRQSKLKVHRRMGEAVTVLDGTTKSRVALLTGISPDDIDRLGGIGRRLGSPYASPNLRQ